MRLLYITNGFPYPLTSGYLRHYHFIRGLARQHSIDLVALSRTRVQESHRAVMQRFVRRVEVFEPPRALRSFSDKIRSKVHAWRGGLGPLSEMCHKVEQLVRAESFDAVVLSGKQTPPVISRLAGLPLIIDMCDAASLRIRGAMRHARAIAAVPLLGKYLRMRRIERYLVRKADHLLFASQRDRDAAMGKGRHDRRFLAWKADTADPTVLPNGVDLDYWRRATDRRNPYEIVFTGAMDYPPNTDAALLLAQSVFPLVRQVCPKATLSLVGRDPTPEVVDAGRRPGVTVTGWVEDVRPYLEQAAVFAAPLRFGAGIQNKLLEALAMEVPIVASRLAADGLRTAEDKGAPILTADAPTEFASMLIRQMQQPSSKHADMLSRRCFVERHFDWQRHVDTLDRVIRSVVQLRAS